jgi:EAL domain-containing protein (putative c-di-GMP-specific phosphodiesterase class I)
MRDDKPGDALPRILVIDDDHNVGEFIAAAAQALDLSCAMTTNTPDFMLALNPDVELIMMDLMMPDTDGIELLRLLGQAACKARVVLMSGFDVRVLETAEELARELGLSVAGHLQKPFRLVELEEMLRSLTKAGARPANAPRPPNLVVEPTIVLEADLRRAISRNEFLLHYQPQIEIKSHPEQRLVFPDAFIQLAESLGLIDELGWLVAKRGLFEIGRFTGKNGAFLTLSLNVSAYSLHDLSFPDRFVELTERYGVSPANVILEITESGLIRELASALDILARLRMKRVQLSIDDFGTGYSMLQQLRLVPATELKIDKIFVQTMHTDHSARVVVQKTIEMGHAIGMQVVAEGVETAGQLDCLRADGCDIAQGYFFSRPLPPTELLSWLRARADRVKGSRETDDLAAGSS